MVDKLDRMASIKAASRGGSNRPSTEVRRLNPLQDLEALNPRSQTLDPRP